MKKSTKVTDGSAGLGEFVANSGEKRLANSEQMGRRNTGDVGGASHIWDPTDPHGSWKPLDGAWKEAIK